MAANIAAKTLPRLPGSLRWKPPPKKADVDKNTHKANPDGGGDFTFEGDESLFGSACFVSEAVGGVLDELEEDDATTASLEGCNVNDDECRAIAEVLKENTALEKLDLSDNLITDSGAMALAEALEENEHLTEINLKQNKISDAGALAFAKMLRVNSTLRILNLRANKIRREGYEELGFALASNTTIVKMYLEFNEISKTNRDASA